MAEPANDPSRSHAAPYIVGDYPKSVFLPDRHTDNLMSVVLQLGTELWTTKRRLLVIEKFLDEKQLVDRAEIEAYMPNEMEQARWNKERDDFIDRVFSVLVRETADTSGRFQLDH